MRAFVTIVRVVATLALGVLAGGLGGSLLFGDSLMNVPWALALLLITLGHGVAGFLLGMVAGRAWLVSLVAAWGAVLSGWGYVMSEAWDIGLVSLVACPAAVGLGAWAGARAIRGGRPAMEPEGASP